MSKIIDIKASWTKQPDWIYRTSILNPYEKALMGLILTNSLGFNSNKYNKKVNYSDLGKQLNINPRIVSRACVSLRKMGLIHYQQTNNEKFLINIDLERCQNYTSINEACQEMTTPTSNKAEPMLENNISDVDKQPSSPLKKDISKDIYKEINKKKYFNKFSKEYLRSRKYDFNEFKEVWLSSNNEAIKKIQFDKLDSDCEVVFRELDRNNQIRCILGIDFYLLFWGSDNQQSQRQFMKKASAYMREYYRWYQEWDKERGLVEAYEERKKQAIEDEKNAPDERDMKLIRAHLRNSGWLK